MTVNEIEYNKKIKGILYIILSALFFSLMNMFVKLAGDLPFIQKSFFRNIIAFFVAGYILYKKKISISLNDKKNLRTLIFRSFFGTLGLLANFYAVDNLNISDASMLNKMSPFFAIIFSYFLLKEKISKFQASILIGAFLGCLLVIKPTFANMSLIPSLIGFSGGICAGLAYTLVRKLGTHGVKGPFIVFFFSGFSCLVTLPFLIFDYHPMTLLQFTFLILAGLSASAAQFSITAAYSNAPAREISVFEYSQVPFSAIVGFIVLNQIPDYLSFLGYVIIISMAVLMYLYNVKGLFKTTTDRK